MISNHLNELSKRIQSPVPFWFLNGHVDEWHIVREFDMMSEKGIGDVIVHPRYGLQTEYLSDDWFRIFGWCVREAKKRAMHVWIYDELNWPSGTAGMSVMKSNPDYRGKFLSVDARPAVEIDIDSFETGVCTAAAEIHGGSIARTLLVENAEALRELSGSWHVFVCTLKHDPFYIDTLSWEAVNCFKQVTYEEYFARFGNEFGGTIRAIFTDEPSVYWVSVGYDDWNLPYTHDYFQTFEAEYGYSPGPMIPYLFYPGRKGTAFRADYWEHAGRLFNERYHGNLGAWCREHGIIYTGHNNHEEPLRYQIRFQGDMFGTMREMDIPGVDHLGKQTLGNSWISVIGHKICSSEAHVSGKARCMSESFGCMDWDTTYTNLKRVTDWQYAQGINLLIPHAIYHTISGMTKRESPPSFFYQSPHWEDFGEFAAYVKRLEEMLCGGRHLCPVAVLFPSSGLWASYQPDRKTADFDHTDNFLNSLCLGLVRNQIDFDFVDSNALAEARLDGGRMLLADEAYSHLIVPSAPYIRQAEVERLNEIVAAGVNTTFFYRSMEPIPQNLPEGLRGAAFVRTEELEAFVDRLKRGLDPDLDISGGGADDIMAYRREKDGRRITFLLNRSEKHRRVTVSLQDYPEPAIFDHETGEWTRLACRKTGRKLQAQLRFHPNQSYFLVSGVSGAPLARQASPEPVPIPITRLTAEAPFNVASIYRFDYSPPPGRGSSVNGAGTGAWVDIRSNPRFIQANWDPNPAPDWESFAGTYEARVLVEFDPDPESPVSMILDRDFADCEVRVNNTQVDLEPCCGPEPANLQKPDYLTDFADVRASVGHLLVRGENTLSVVSPTRLSEPLRLVGDFRVHLRGTDVALVEPGEADPFRLELDYPFYSGTVTYRAEFEVEKRYSSLILNLHDVRDSASVFVNGKPAGNRLWAPYTFEIAALSRPGRNSLRIDVRNNMANLLSGTPRPLGVRHVPTLAASE